MKLHYAAASPFVRKVMVLARETGLAERLTIEPRAISPVAPDSGLNRDNPLGKVPALVTDDGATLYDSRVIAEYLDGLHAGPRLFPADGAARWTALRQQALADGILDAAVISRYEIALRPEALRWQDWLDGQWGKIARALDALEAEAAAGGFSGPLTIGTIAAGCALGYLDFRFAARDWRGGRPALARWYAEFGERPSMRETRPPAG